MKKIIYLESQQNLVWTSMQEIFPCLKKTWKKFCSDSPEISEIKFIDVDTTSPKAVLKDILTSDLIVVSSFNGKMAQFLEVIRVHLNIDTPWAFYLHGLATVGLWPLGALGFKKVLHANDVFLGTCAGDKEALELALPQAKYLQTTFFSLEECQLPALNEDKLERIVYIGRVSRQKNLHQLLWALSLLKNKSSHHKNVHLEIFGAEDGLDAPNVGLARGEYQKELKEIMSSLGLKENHDVTFHGFRRREEIEASLKEGPFLFASFSLHSDENFGMAALMALQNGGRLLLSDWGGHKNFKHYSHRVTPLPVWRGSNGPCLDINECVAALESSLSAKADKAKESQASLSRAVTGLGHFIGDGDAQESHKLSFSTLVDELLKVREGSPDKEAAQKVFDGYKDPHAHKFFAAYGAVKREGEAHDFHHYELAPWAIENQGKIEVHDPHRGLWSGGLKEAIELGYVFLKKE